MVKSICQPAPICVQNLQHNLLTKKKIYNLNHKTYTRSDVWCVYKTNVDLNHRQIWPNNMMFTWFEISLDVAKVKSNFYQKNSSRPYLLIYAGLLYPLN